MGQLRNLRCDPTPPGEPEVTCPVSRVMEAAAPQPRAAVPVREHEPSVAKSPAFLKLFSNSRKWWSLGYEITRFLKVGNSIMFLTNISLAKQNTSVGQTRGLPACSAPGRLVGGGGASLGTDLDCGYFRTSGSRLPWSFRAHVYASCG